MAEDRAVDPELSAVLERFPEREALARYLYRTHPAFRSTCEDYRLATDGFSKFLKLSESAPRRELDEYRTLVRELEAEIVAMFGAADAASRPSASGPRTPPGQ